MIDLAGPPAIGGATMLGLNFVRTFDSFSCFGIKPMTKKAAPAKPSSPPTTSSPSATSSAPPKLSLWERLDACVQKDGAMDPFYTMFDQNLFDIGSANPLIQDITTSIKSPQVPAASQGITSCTTLPPHMRDALEVTPFSALFPEHLLLESVQVEPVTQAEINDLPALATSPPCHLSIHPDQSLHDQVMSNDLTNIDADLVGHPNDYTSGQGDSGRTSPQSYAGIGEDVGSLFGTLNSSRRSSWATSINTSRADADDSSANKSAANLDDNEDIIELIHDYEHYSDLIDVGHSDHVRKRDFIAPVPDAATAEKDTQVFHEPTTEAHADTITACPEALAMNAATYQPEEPDMEVAAGGTHAHTQAADDCAAEASGYTVLECPCTLTMEDGPEQVDEPAQPEVSSSPRLELPHTPAEEIAWAHSHCDDSPENERLRILTDERGREYVLYHNCFHVLPIDMAREFMQRENDDDDLDVPRQLGTMPEEEDEG